MSARTDQTTSPWQRLGSGIHSVVWRARKSSDSTGILSNHSTRVSDVESDPVGDLINWVVVKVVYDNRSMPPHDIVREAAILRDISHINIITFLGFIQGGPDHAPYALYMPLVPLSLTVILSSPLFCPSPLTGPYSVLSRPILAPVQQPEGANPFTTVSKSLVYQLLLAISHLHSLDPPVAHRDINPGNVLVDCEGVVKLVDFGIAWSPRHVQTASSSEATHMGESARRHPFDGWTETPEKMCCQVATGPHRPPELLFSPTSYSAAAVDLWSLGTTIAQFFTPLRLIPSQSPLSSPTSSASDDADPPVPSPFFISPSLRHRIDYRATWERMSLFNGERGELGLAWSIFKLRGTPSEDTWPSFTSLPDVSKIEFQKVSPKPLHTVLPHLPPSDVADSSPATHLPVNGLPVSLIDSLLAYPPSSRLSAARAIRHQWFSADLLLPVSHPGADPTHLRAGNDESPRSTKQLRGRTLAGWLEPVMNREAGRLTRN